MWQNTSVIDKMYKKLVIQVSLKGLSFASFDTLTNKVVALEKIPLGNFDKNTTIEELFSDAFLKYEELKAGYDQVVIIHSNNLSTFVPTVLFDEEYIGSYLQFNTKVFETDFFAFDEIENYQMNNVYIPYVNMNNFFIDQFGVFDYKHANSILVEKILDLSKNTYEQKMYIHIAETHFEIVVIRNQKLDLYNSFEYKTPEDFLYYVLFTAEQLHLNPESFSLTFLGAIDEEHPLFKIAYKYIRNVELLEIDASNSSYSEAQLREHFILINA
jgi:hypothetical protein